MRFHLLSEKRLFHEFDRFFFCCCFFCCTLNGDQFAHKALTSKTLRQRMASKRLRRALTLQHSSYLQPEQRAGISQILKAVERPREMGRARKITRFTQANKSLYCY